MTKADQNRQAIIVGFGPGLGAALADRFSRGGFSIIGLCRNPSHHPTVPGIELRKIDAADLQGLANAVEACGATSVLIYNAFRMTGTKTPASLEPEDLIQDFKVNVAGAAAALQAVLPSMQKAGNGSVLMTGGGLALDPTFWLEAASLAISKSGLRSFALSLHKELAPLNIHAGTVTIAGQIAKNTSFDPMRIADAFWDLHSDPPGQFRSEIVFRG